jgi:hypothetical protein
MVHGSQEVLLDVTASARSAGFGKALLNKRKHMIRPRRREQVVRFMADGVQLC